MYNKTNKKKLELKKTAIANLTLSEAQMGMVLGGGAELKTEPATQTCKCTLSLVDDGGGACGTRPTRPVDLTL